VATAAAAAHSSCQQHGGGVFPEPADTRRVLDIRSGIYKVLLVYEITTAAAAVVAAATTTTTKSATVAVAATTRRPVRSF